MVHDVCGQQRLTIEEGLEISSESVFNYLGSIDENWTAHGEVAYEGGPESRYSRYRLPMDSGSPSNLVELRPVENRKRFEPEFCGTLKSISSSRV